MPSFDRHDGRWTRRQLLLRCGGLALTGLGAAELAGRGGRHVTPAPPPGPAAVAPPRCVTLGADGVINPGSSQDYRNCRAFLLDTGTRWVRLWADWPSLQPEADRAPDAGSGAWRVRELDRQIAQANADGVKLILTSYRFPTWANGALGGVKDPLLKLPPDLTPASPWANWIGFFVKRYGRSIAALEVVNEPNEQVWPLTGVHKAVAQMFQTAQAITTANGSTPLLLGPATSDTRQAGIPYDTFTKNLLDELDRIGFLPGRNFAWSHHNYTDVEQDEAHGVKTTRELLTNRWAGWPHADASDPVILIPEGGARLSKLATIYRTSETRALQAKLINRNWERMAKQPGVGMLGQYLFYSDPHFDCGLCDPDGAKRPAFGAWAALPQGM